MSCHASLAGLRWAGPGIGGRIARAGLVWSGYEGDRGVFADYDAATVPARVPADMGPPEGTPAR